VFGTTPDTARDFTGGERNKRATLLVELATAIILTVSKVPLDKDWNLGWAYAQVYRLSNFARWLAIGC
jgi:hypothetical protein